MKGSEHGDTWRSIIDGFDGERVVLTPELARRLSDPRAGLLDELAAYKFAAKMIGGGRRVLDLGCTDGLGALVLAIECGDAVGLVEGDADADELRARWNDRRLRFAVEIDAASTTFDSLALIDPAGAQKPGAITATIEFGVTLLGRDGIAILCVPGRGAAPAITAARKAFRHLFTFSLDRRGIAPGPADRRSAALILAAVPRR